MAYASLVSVVQILDQLLHSDSFPIPYPKTQIEFLHEKVLSLQSTFEKVFPVPKSWRNSVNDLETQIRNSMYDVQDTIESFIYRQNYSSESEEIPRNLEEMTKNVEAMAKLAEEIGGSMSHTKEEHQTGDPSQSEKYSSSSGKSNKIVGQEEDLDRVTTELLNEAAERLVVPITGLAGIGKTTLARSIYDSKAVESHFYIRAWVTVSQEYYVGDIFLKLLGSMVTKGQKSDASDSIKNLGDKVSQRSELSVDLYKNLFNKRYLVVIDDIWDTKVWDDIKNSFPDNNKDGSRILLTTRCADVAKYAKTHNFLHEMRPLDPEKSWELLCEKVFAGGACPPSLDPIGRKIAEDCGGLPLSITVVGGQLSQERKTVEYWKLVQEDIHGVSSESKESYLEILSLSYNHLPGRLKGCFLYMAAFPEDSEIPVSKLIKLWVAEGFLKPSPSSDKYLEQVAKEYLKNLVDRNLVLARKFSADGQIKRCGMHDSVREIALKRCREDKFFHSINRYVQEPSEDMSSQRRLSVHRNILMCMNDVRRCTKSVTSARTLVYAGPHHHHPLPSCLTFDLLRVLDAFTVYLIKFPDEVVKLIHLRYLSLTYNGNLPPSISKLRSLQILIVRQHPRIILVGSSILPLEIWNMPQMRHLQFTESGLPVPVGVFRLEILQTLSNVHAACCTEDILENMPNLNKLGMWIEAPGAVQFQVGILEQLEALKFTVLNPDPESELSFLPRFVLPKTLKRLSLSGCGLPWEKMKVIGQLPNLEVLKLREMAFQGTMWSPKEDDYKFSQLKFLLLESLDLATWDADNSHFPSLKSLNINYCLDLEGIPLDFQYIGPLKLIELVDCSPFAVESANYIKDEVEGNKDFQVRVFTSWE